MDETQIARPAISFETIVISDGTRLNLDEDDIVVFVGPNNAGKSAALRELEEFIRRNKRQKVIQGASLRKSGTLGDFRDYLTKNALMVRENEDIFYAGIGYNIHSSHLTYFDNDRDRHPIASFFCTRLPTETRITSSNAAGSIRLHREAPHHPIHLLLMDNELATKVSDLFRRAFGVGLLPFRAGGSSFPLYVGEHPALSEGEDALSKAYVDAFLDANIPLHEQGDGMRSFATILLHVLAAGNHSIQFLDEPEAFLHPPQARLIGEIIARDRINRSQLFIATHSTDILDGLIASGSHNIRIVRLQRDGVINRAKELSRERISTIVRDTLARYSGVFEGIFYRHVVICESDADCLFYSSILHTQQVTGELRADVHFVHAAGKHRMARLAETLKALDVPVSVIADIDILNDEEVFRDLFTVLGGDWTEALAHWRAIRAAVEARRPPLTGAQVRMQIEQVLDSIELTKPFPKDATKNIRRVIETLSPWDDVKRIGRNALVGAQAIRHFDSISKLCESRKLYIVQVGELEGFCRSIEAAHGPAFVAKVLEERNLDTDPELQEARAFVARIWKSAQSPESSERGLSEN